MKIRINNISKKPRVSSVYTDLKPIIKSNGIFFKCHKCGKEIYLYNYEMRCYTCDLRFTIKLLIQPKCDHCKYKMAKQIENRKVFSVCINEEDYIHYIESNDCTKFEDDGMSILKRERSKANSMGINNGKKACQMFACKPAQTLWLDLYSKEFNMVLTEPVKRVIIMIEKSCYKLNKPRTPHIVIGLAIYLYARYADLKISQAKISDMVGITPTSIRSLAATIGIVSGGQSIHEYINNGFKEVENANHGV